MNEAAEKIEEQDKLKWDYSGKRNQSLNRFRKNKLQNRFFVWF